MGFRNRVGNWLSGCFGSRGGFGGWFLGGVGKEGYWRLILIISKSLMLLMIRNTTLNMGDFLS